MFQGRQKMIWATTRPNMAPIPQTVEPTSEEKSVEPKQVKKVQAPLPYGSLTQGPTAYM